MEERWETVDVDFDQERERSDRKLSLLIIAVGFVIACVALDTWRLNVSKDLGIDTPYLFGELGALLILIIIAVASLSIAFFISRKCHNRFVIFVKALLLVFYTAFIVIMGIHLIFYLSLIPTTAGDLVPILRITTVETLCSLIGGTFLVLIYAVEIREAVDECNIVLNGQEETCTIEIKGETFETTCKTMGDKKMCKIFEMDSSGS